MLASACVQEEPTWAGWAVGGLPFLISIVLVIILLAARGLVYDVSLAARHRTQLCAQCARPRRLPKHADS